MILMTWISKAADEIMDDLSGRKGIFDDIDDDEILAEIRNQIIFIICKYHSEGDKAEEL